MKNKAPKYVVAIARGSIILLLCAVGAAASTIYDAASAFEQAFVAQSNPSGVWSAGYSSGSMGAVTLYTEELQNGVNGPDAQYWASPSVNIGNSPSEEYNNGAAYNDGNVNMPADGLLLVSGIGGETSDLVFTAPASGIFGVGAIFRGDQYGIGVVVGVASDGTLLFDSNIDAEGQTVSFTTDLNLTAGETVVFSAGPDGGLQNTGITADITQLSSASSTPEPSTIAMTLVGALLLLVGRCQRRLAVDLSNTTK